MTDLSRAEPPRADAPSADGLTTDMVVGLDFGGTKIAAAACDLDGKLLAEGTVATEPHLGGLENLARGVRAVELVMKEASESREQSGDKSPRLVSLSAATFGIPTEEGVVLSPAVPGWDRVALSAALSRAFPSAKVNVMTDVKAAAALEARQGALAGHDPGMYVNLGTGLAVALVVGGSIVRGANGAFGEIGYSLHSAQDLWRSDRDKQLLEHVVSGMGLRATTERMTGRAMSAAEVFEAAEHDERLQGLLDEMFDELCYHVVNLAIALDPSCIAVGGGMVRSFDRFEPRLRRALDANVPFPPSLLTGAFPYDAPLKGALMDAFERSTGRVPQLRLQPNESLDLEEEPVA